MEKKGFRDRRVGELLRQEISRIIFEDIKDPRVDGVVITDVVVSKDLSIAKVYFSLLNPENSENTKSGLESCGNFIHSKLIKELRMKKVPKLIFFIDDTVENSVKIEKIIRDINQNN